IAARQCLTSNENYLPDRGVSCPGCRSFSGRKFACRNQERNFRGRMFLVHSTGVRQGTWRDQDNGGLLRRDGTESDLQPRWLGKNEVPRIDRDRLRSRQNFLRAVARHLLEANRSDAIRRAVYRYWPKLSGRDFLQQR